MLEVAYYKVLFSLDGNDFSPFFIKANYLPLISVMLHLEHCWYIGKVSWFGFYKGLPVICKLPNFLGHWNFLVKKFRNFCMHKISEQRKCLQTYGSLDDKLFFIKEIVELLDKVEVLAEVFHKAEQFLE